MAHTCGAQTSEESAWECGPSDLRVSSGAQCHCKVSSAQRSLPSVFVQFAWHFLPSKVSTHGVVGQFGNWPFHTEDSRLDVAPRKGGGKGGAWLPKARGGIMHVCGQRRSALNANLSLVRRRQGHRCVRWWVNSRSPLAIVGLWLVDRMGCRRMSCHVRVAR